MPIYEFACEEDKLIVEEFQSFDDDAPKCPECGNEMERIISASAFHLKGSGWYKSGYSGRGNTETEYRTDKETPNQQEVLIRDGNTDDNDGKPVIA